MTLKRAVLKGVTIGIGVAALAACAAATPPSPAVTGTRAADAVAGSPTGMPLPVRASAISEPDWHYTGSADDFDTYVDANNIVDRNGYRYAWEKTAYRSGRRNGAGNPYSYKIALVAYHCPSARWAVASLAQYSETGSVVYSGSYDDRLQWEHVIPGSSGAADAAFVCDVSPGQRPRQPAPVAPNAGPGRVSPAAVFKKVKNSVWVLVSFNPKNGKADPDGAALGSAVAVGPTSLFTNCHTLKGHAYHIILRTDAEEPMPVTIVNADYDGDRCVVESRERLPAYVEIKPYDAIDIGEEAYSIGTPRGLELTMADGIVSAKRTFDGVRYLQTTAPISPGSSGGGLFDGSGRLIGITTWYRQDSQNLNFAIAADAF
ncbi:MAG: serine protease [Rhodospirillales bacterium]